MKLTNFLYNLDEFYLSSQELNLPGTIKNEWDKLYNKYVDFNEPFLNANSISTARDNHEFNILMREILIFVLDNFRYFNYCFAYEVDDFNLIQNYLEQRKAICPRLTLDYYNQIFNKLEQDYVIFEESFENYVFEESFENYVFEPNNIFILKSEFMDGDEGEYFVIEDRGDKVLASPNWETGLSILPQEVIFKYMIADVIK